jgi:hypothetical protein
MASSSNRISSGSTKLLAALPSLIIILALLHILPFLLPDTHDGLTESYEPAKTLRFIYTHGAAVHKWGPFPSLIFGPVYACVLLIAKMGGHLGKLTSQYPFGFDNAVLQMGHMLLAARTSVLLLGALSVYYLCRTLQRALNNTLAPVIALLLCLTTSLVFLEPLADTKPDGMMVSLLICALANYIAIVLEGITVRTALGLAFFYVASLSCKELTSTTLMLPYLGLLVAAVPGRRSNHQEGNRFLRLLVLSMAAVPVFYLLINVVYAPHAWHDRIAYVFGPLKDPAAWAGPGQTKLSYLRDTGYAVFAALGWGGIFALALTLAGTIQKPSRALLLLWLPFIGHLVFTTYLGGYMPTYFMLPLGPTLALPASYLLAGWLKAPSEQPQATARLSIATICLSAACLFFALSATTLFTATHTHTLMQQAIQQQTSPGSTVDVVGLWSASHTELTPGPYGRTIDHRPLYLIMQAPQANRPPYALIAIDTEKWTEEIPARPARAALLKADTNFDYSGFKNFNALGYQLSGVTRPALPAWIFPALVPGSNAYVDNGIDVYRLKSSAISAQQNDATPRGVKSAGN